MKLDLSKVWKTTRTATGRVWRGLLGWIGKAQWLRKPLHWLKQPLHWLRRIPDAFPALGRLLRRMANATGPLLRPFRRAGTALVRVPVLLWSGVRWLGRAPGQLKRALLAGATRVWSLIFGLLAVPGGAWLVTTPAKQLLTTHEFDLRTLLPVSLALCGLLTLTAGLGMLFRAPSFRASLWFALLFSLPLPSACGFDTYTLLVKMNGADESAKKTLQPVLEGDIQRTLMYLGLSLGLCVLLWLRPLRHLKLQCTTPLLRGRAGVLLAPCYGAAFGLAAGYGLWLGLRELTERSLQFLRPVLGVVKAEHLAYGCGALGALWLLRRWWRGRTHVTPRTTTKVTAPKAPAPKPTPATPPPTSTPPQRPVVATPQPAKPIQKPQPVGWLSSRT
jgi:hypothetical protein